MAALSFGKRRLMAAAGVLLAAAAGVGVWVERTNLLAWVQVRGLAGAGDADRPRWVARVVNLGEAAVPPLLALLQRGDEQPSHNARIALDELVNCWGLDDPRTACLVRQLGQEFSHLSVAGQQQTLLLAMSWFTQADKHSAPSGPLRAALLSLVTAAEDQEEEVRACAMDLCGVLLRLPHAEDVLVPARTLIRSCLQAELPERRVRAVRLTLVEGLDLLEQVVPLLHDPSAEVRRAAILAAGPADHLVRDESLLPCLHDSDPEVRRLCELALQARGLRPEHLHLGRLLTDAKPVVRLQVLDYLYHAGDLDPGLWLRRLSHDPSPAVRAGAVRMMSQLAQIDLSDRIDQMARSDPSPTVSELARYYLKGRHTVPRPVEP